MSVFAKSISNSWFLKGIISFEFGTATILIFLEGMLSTLSIEDILIDFVVTSRVV